MIALPLSAWMLIAAVASMFLGQILLEPWGRPASKWEDTAGITLVCLALILLMLALLLFLAEVKHLT